MFNWEPVIYLVAIILVEGYVIYSLLGEVTRLRGIIENIRKMATPPPSKKSLKQPPTTQKKRSLKYYDR